MSTTLTPKSIVKELDRYIIGQGEAKKAVALALRNRWRRLQLEENLREEVLPKNILMIGPTGVGKTEIARRLAKLANAPFLKVEATKFTEVGYVGRDVEQIGRDLLEIAINLVRDRMQEEVREKAEAQTVEKILDILVGEEATSETRESFRKRLEEGELDEKEIEIQVQESSALNLPTFDVPGVPGAQMGMINLSDMLGKALGNKTKAKTLKIEDAYDVLVDEQMETLLDQEHIIREALHLAEQDGIVFLDEIDKICGNSDRHGGDVSREGVQRDLLPLIEGTTINTKYGILRTDHILFIASGAFHVSKPSDLLPELQGRLPIRVELKPLTQSDFIRILRDTEASLIIQSKALLGVEEVNLEFTDDAIAELALLAAEINNNVENIGARRLHTVIEKTLEDISFNADDYSKQTFEVTAEYVRKIVGSLAKNADISKFIL